MLQNLYVRLYQENAAILALKKSCIPKRQTEFLPGKAQKSVNNSDNIVFTVQANRAVLPQIPELKLHRDQLVSKPQKATSCTVTSD